MGDVRRGVWPLFGNVIGVGIFALPYSLVQAGWVGGTVSFVVAAIVATVLLVLYGNLALALGGHGRFVGLIREETNPLLGFLASITFFGALYGAMIAFILFGSSFAATVFGPIIGGGIALYRWLFFAVGAFAILGGSYTVARLQRGLFLLLTGLLAALVVVAFPAVDMTNFDLPAGSPLASFGVMLFAFTGFGAIPEMRDALGRNKHALIRTALWGMGIVTIFYAVFMVAVVGVSGRITTPDALLGLGAFLGRPVLLLGSVIGLCATFNAFVTQGVVLMRTWVYDLRFSYLAGWVLAVLVPFLLILLGAEQVVRVLELTGGIGTGFAGVVLILAYERIRQKPTVPKGTLTVPSWLVFCTFVACIASIVLALM